MKKPLPIVTITLDKIVGGGQALGTMDDGRKIFVWGGLPGETVEVQLTKKKSKMAEGIVTNVIIPSSERIEPVDPDSYLSTSPWQIMSLDAEQHYKAALIEEAFELHDIVLPNAIDIYSDGVTTQYRNKMEYSWWWDKELETLDLAFFRRGSHAKYAIQTTSLAMQPITDASIRMRAILRARSARGMSLKTLLARASRDGTVALQLYVKDPEFEPFTDDEIAALQVASFELIYSNPQSPASVMTEHLQKSGDIILSDTIKGVEFRYATEGFFQVNLPIYEQALTDMAEWIQPGIPVVDFYSGVGSIGLTIGGDNVTLVEVNESAVREMKENIKALGKTNATAVLAASEKALDYIKKGNQIIVDPPRAGLDNAVIERLLEEAPDRIIYLSCNPVTQARDVELLAQTYGIKWHRGYNFFPRTPHIEHLVILEKK